MFWPGKQSFCSAGLMPHGVVEIPAILIAGQAGLVLARAVIGWGTRDSFKMRLRAIRNDLMTLIGGVAILLVWAGTIEAFLSQYHEPVIPYWSKSRLAPSNSSCSRCFLPRRAESPPLILLNAEFAEIQERTQRK